MSSFRSKLVLPVVVVAGGLGVAYLLTSARTPPERVDRVSPGPLVEVIEARPADVQVEVEGNGEVGAKISVTLVPQVSGRILAVHAAMVSGGFFKAGEALVTIDPRDYELARDRARATVARAEVTLEREQAEADVARQEWDALHPDEAPPHGLVVREPQIRQAEAELEAARADLAAAELDLERTRMTVPFDGVVVSESVDVGQYVSAGSTLATVFAVGAVEIRVPLESRELGWFDAPRRPSDPASPATVRSRFAGGVHEWPGRVVRTEAQVDPGSRMIHAVVEVARPFARTDGRPSLLPGSFVEVVIEGRTLDGVVPVPRHAVHQGDTVWVVDDGRLEIRPVEIARADRHSALVTAGLEAGDQVVVSALDAVTDGMAVRAVATGASSGETAPVEVVIEDGEDGPGGGSAGGSA